MNNGKICVSVCAETANELIENIKRAEEFSDVIELRFDCLNPKEIHKASVFLVSPKPLLLTYRPKEQGGKQELTRLQRIAFWNTFVNSVDDKRKFWIDYEYDLKNKIQKMSNPVTIKSFHDFLGIPGNLNEIYKNLSAENEVAKIAVQADDITDSLAVWKLLERAKKDNKQIVPIAMGEAGRWTRILGLANGAPLTYASLDAGKETAAGQITAREMIDVYRVKELNEETEIYGIIGNPVSHSLSPFMHNAAFKYHNLNAVYIPFEVKNLDAFVTKMIRPETRELDWNLKGFSVTIPHKQTIIKYLDEIDETARKIGAVNIVKIENGKLLGYNTDADGFLASLKSLYGDLQNAKVAVLGAGGSARACIFALKKEGADVFVYARNIEKAKDLAIEFKVKLKELQIKNNKLQDFDIVVNTTPLGTKGELESQTPVTSSEIQNVKFALDLIYNPPVTQFMREAKKSDVQTFNGLRMLAWQAMMQFKIWTGRDAPMRLMMSAASKKLTSKQ